MYLGKETVEKIKAAGVLKLAQKYTKLKKITDNVYRGHCPHPDHDDKTPSFDVIVDDNGKETWCCWGCHAGSHENIDNIGFVRWMSEHKGSSKPLGFVEAALKVAEFYGIPIDTDNNKNSWLLKKNRDMAEIYEGNLYPDVVNYLKFRGLDETDIENWHVGFDGDRITIPIIDEYGEYRGFSNREFSEKSKSENRKYVNSCNSEVFDKKRILFGIDHYDRTSPYILITEGQFDCMLAHKYGLSCTVSTLSCHLSEQQIEKIKKLNKIPVICYDSDRAGHEGTEKALADLAKSGVKNARILPLPSGKDLADLALEIREDLPRYFEEKQVTYSRHCLEQYASILDERMNQALQELMPKINATLENIVDPDEATVARNFVQRRLHLWAS